MWTDNLLGIPLIYCICGDIDDDTLIDDVIGDDGTDGKSQARKMYEANTHYVGYYLATNKCCWIGCRCNSLI